MEVRKLVGGIRGSNNSHMSNSNRARTPRRNGQQNMAPRTPRASERTYRNDVSPLRQRFQNNARVP